MCFCKSEFFSSVPGAVWIFIFCCKLTLFYGRLLSLQIVKTLPELCQLKTFRDMIGKRCTERDGQMHVQVDHGHADTVGVVPGTRDEELAHVLK